MTSKIVRTDTKATGGVTPEELAQMKDHVEMWKKRIMRTKSANEDFPKLKAAIDGICEAANVNKLIVVLVPSPIVMSYAYGAAAAIWYKRSKGEKIEVPVNKSGVYNPTWDAVALATSMSKEPLSASVVTGKAVADPIAQARNTCKELAGDFGLECAKRWNNSVQCGAYGAFDDCYFTAFRDILKLKLPVFEKYKHWEQAAIYGTLRVIHDKFCLVADFPEALKVDDTNRSHCQDGPSHRWSDGWELYHWHGVRIPGEWIKDKKSLDVTTAITWKNIEQRRAACEILGWDVILTNSKNAKMIDKDADMEIGELWEVILPDIGKEKFLRVLCGTKRQFALPVPPEMKTAMEANAWTYGFKLEDFKVPEIRT